MKKALFVVSQAKLEYIDSRNFYSLHSSSLGRSFQIEVETTMERVRSFPEIGFAMGKGIQRVLVNRFPFSIFYREYESKIVVYAIASQHREPNYWVDRL